jgi:multiple sugar transport system ATP-binding protein
MTVTTEVVEDLGGVSNLLFPVDAKRVVTDATRAAVEAGSDDEGTLLADDQRARFCAAIQGRHAVAAGQDVELALNHRHLHFFDPESGAAL